MRIELDDLKNGWYEMFIGVTENDIDQIINMLTLLKKEHDQHFHILNKYEEEPGICDIEIYYQDGEEEDNMMISGPPITPNNGD